MKHPALARVFSIVLAIMSLFMLLNGAFGFGKADAALKDSMEEYRRLEEKTDTYAQLSAQLESSVSYEEALAELEAMQEQHDEDAAQHRTDLATHTATMGGYEMGANMIRDGQEQLAQAKAELETGKKQLAEKEQQLNQAAAAFNAAKPQAEGTISGLYQAAGPLSLAASGVEGMITWLSALSPQPENPGETAPDVPQKPAPVDKPTEPGEDATDEEKGEYQLALAAYEKYPQEKAEYDEAVAARAEYTEKKATYDGWRTQYVTAVGDINVQLGTMVDPKAAAAGLNAAVSALASAAPELAAGVPDAAVNVPTLLADLSPEENIAALSTFQGELNEAASIPSAIQKNLSAMEAQLAAGQQALAQGKAKLVQGEEALKKGENELQHQLELLWYNMGQLEDEAVELEESKTRLDQETEELDRRLVSVDEKKEIERKYRSSRVILMREDAIASAVDAGQDLTEAARNYIQDGREAARHRHTLLYIINALALAGGLLGLLSIPGSFEKTGRRLLLILPTVLCLACALGAEGLNLRLGLGQMYTALAAALAAVLHLAAILPKNKTAAAG